MLEIGHVRSTTANREDDGMGQDGLNAPQVFWMFYFDDTLPKESLMLLRDWTQCTSYLLYPLIPLYLSTKKNSPIY